MERGDIDMDKKHGQNKEKSMYMTCGLFIQYNGTRALQRIRSLGEHPKCTKVKLRKCNTYEEDHEDEIKEYAYKRK